MADLNHITLLGRMGADPELKQTTNGLSVSSFSVAVSKLVKAGEHPESDWIDCVAWKNTAEFITKYFKKGSKIIIEGRLSTRKYTDKEGKEHKIVEVIVSNAYFVEKKTDSPPSVQTSPPTQSYEPDTSINNSDNDLPF